MKKNKIKKNHIEPFVVNFFNAQPINYTELIELQSKETSSSIYNPNK